VLIAAVPMVTGHPASEEPSLQSPEGHGEGGVHAAPVRISNLSVEQDVRLSEILAEHMKRVAFASSKPGAMQEIRDLQAQLEERLADVLTPEQVEDFRQIVPVVLHRSRTALEADAAAAADACTDGYNAIGAGRGNASTACNFGQADYQIHTNHNRNTWALQEFNTNCAARNLATQALNLANQALSDCNYADDAATKASQAAVTAANGANRAALSYEHCQLLADPPHTNLEAFAANQYAVLAALQLDEGSQLESDCAACCFTLPAPNATGAFAQGASNIRVEWQDQSSQESGFEIQKSINGGGFSTIGTRGANVEFFIDNAASTEDNIRYRARAIHAGCGVQSGWSPVVIVPKAPNNLTYTRSGNNVTLNWNDRSTLETNYEIHRKLGSGAWALLYTVPANAETKANIPLQAGVNRFRVRAKASTGFSWYTNEVSVTR
jgi:hypothetical protein